MELNHEDDEIVVREEEVQQLLESLEKVAIRITNRFHLVNYQGFFYPATTDILKKILMCQRHFCAQDTDLIIASHPKTGTTWLKSLLFSIVNRFKHPQNESPLLKHHPHELVYRLEIDIYGEAFECPRPHQLNELPSPRLFSTHLPCTSLPESILSSRCRVLYICRNPLDTIVSLYYFMLDVMKKVIPEDKFIAPALEDLFEDFYDGKTVHGPFFEHVVEYWKMSLEHPDKVLFLKYEDLKNDPAVHVKKLAEFVGMPFSPHEENEGVIQDIIQLCSIKNLKELEVNKSGVFNKFFDKKSYFRKGEVGDGAHHFAPDMVERMNKLVQEKLEGTSLSFE